MGAWRYLNARFGERLLGRWPFAGVARYASASPATGSAKSHALEQQQLVERAFAVEVNNDEGSPARGTMQGFGTTGHYPSLLDPAAVAKDPLNLLLHHHPLRRLEGESIRDSILAVSGRLDRSVGGVGVEVFLTEFHDGRGRPQSGPLDGAGRRSLYTRIRRNFLPSFLVVFDMPVPFQAMGRRNITNVPAQALSMMNDPFVAEQAGLWAKRILSESARPVPAGPGPVEGDPALTNTRIERMYREAFGRRPSADEAGAARAFLVEQSARHGSEVQRERLPEPLEEHGLVRAHCAPDLVVVTEVPEVCQLQPEELTRRRAHPLT